MTACRLITAFALLIHSVLGCGMHHASGCETHRRDACSAIHNSAHRHADHVVNHGHHDCHHDDDADDRCEDESNSGVGPLACCQFGPCESHEKRCHGELVCSYKPSSGPEFLVEVGPVTFVAPSDLYARQLLSAASNAATVDGVDPRLHFALLCTWLI